MTRRCVLILHGFLGGPKQFDRLISFIRARGVDVCAPLLPGHGGDVAAFARVNKADWLAFVRAEITRLQNEYDEIFLVTHSMGGLLALLATREGEADRIKGALAAREHKGGIKGLLALALPLRVRVSPACLRLWLSVGLFPDKIKNERLLAAKNACTVAGISAKNFCRLIPNALGLLALARDARKLLRGGEDSAGRSHTNETQVFTRDHDDLPGQTARSRENDGDGRPGQRERLPAAPLAFPVTVLQSPRDEIVPRSAARLAANAGASVAFLADSGHFYYAPDDWIAIENALVAILGDAQKSI